MKNRLRSIALTLALTLPLTLIYAQSFPGLNWSYALPAPSFGSAASADVDEDGFLEISLLSLHGFDAEILHAYFIEDDGVGGAFGVNGLLGKEADGAGQK